MYIEKYSNVHSNMINPLIVYFYILPLLRFTFKFRSHTFRQKILDITNRANLRSECAFTPYELRTPSNKRLLLS